MNNITYKNVNWARLAEPPHHRRPRKSIFEKKFTSGRYDGAALRAIRATKGVGRPVQQ